MEAARAGEHGCRVTMFADEVTKLANRSGQAASSINAMVKDVQRRPRDEYRGEPGVRRPHETLSIKHRLDQMTHTLAER
ncbi:MAG: methyl-accepting chemotaxis protein [Nitrospira sp.]